MPGTDLVRVEEERQVRSYQGAFSGELTLYSLGRDLRPWRPIPARQIFWTVGLVITMFVFGRVLGVSLQVWSMGWFFFYFLLPGGLGWLFTHALVEGRRLHVVVASWARHALYGRNLAGGHRRISRHSRPLKATKIRVEAVHSARSPVPLHKIAAVLGVAVFSVLTLSVISSQAGHAARVSRLVPSPRPGTLTLAEAQRIRAVLHPYVPARPSRAVRHAAARRPIHQRRAAAHVRHVHRARHAKAPAPAPLPAPRPVRRVVSAPAPVVPAPAPAPVAVSAPAPAPAPVAAAPSRPSTPPCYPGQLGC